jgi:hypothetical protein
MTMSARSQPFVSRLTITGAIWVVWLLFPALASSAPINVGSIFVDDYRVVSDANQGGLNFIIHYTLNGNFANQNCCDQGNLRWLQLVTFNPNQPGFPNGQFVDPTPGQNIGGGQTGDMLPWYDITSNSLDFSVGNRQFGKGPYLGDGPFASWTSGSLNFTAYTLLVCILSNDATKFAVLGGVSWGYSNDAPNKKTTIMPLMQVNDSQGLDDSINTALGKVDKFKGFTAVLGTTAWTTDQPFVNLPEAGSGSMLGIALVAVVALRRRVRAS